MATKYKVFWYQKSAFIKNAFLNNCRDSDLRRSRNGWIKEGQIVKGAVGYVMAEHNLPGFIGKIVRFKPNRECRWFGSDLSCMAHVNTPGSNCYLRPFNYVVAQLSDEKMVKIAVEKRVPVIVTPDQKLYVNLEIFWSFPKQDKKRRAKLL